MRTLPIHTFKHPTQTFPDCKKPHHDVNVKLQTEHDGNHALVHPEWLDSVVARTPLGYPGEEIDIANGRSGHSLLLTQLARTALS